MRNLETNMYAYERRLDLYSLIYKWYKNECLFVMYKIIEKEVILDE